MGQQTSDQLQQIVIPKPGIIVPKSTKQVMSDQKIGYIYLGLGRWRVHEVYRYAPFLQQWKVKKGLVLDGNKQPFILNQIINIKFQLLLQLSLRQNNIESIQILPRLYIPNIEKIYFCGNNITTIKPLRRLYAPNLGFLSFNANQTLQTVNFTFLETDLLQQLYLHLNGTKLVNLNEIAKVKSKNLNKIWLTKQSQKGQDKCFKVLKNKFKGFCWEEFKKDPALCER